MPIDANRGLNLGNREDGAPVPPASNTHDRPRLAADPDRLPTPGWQEGSVARTDGRWRQANVHAGWRMERAEVAAGAYASNKKLAALAVAGSVGTGLADRFSDLELDCYWLAPPGDLDRRGPVRELGGDSEVIWDYAPDIEEWSDDYQLGDLHVSISSFLVATIERFLDDVIVRTDTDPVKHIRLAALQRCHPLIGVELMRTWRSRAGLYPDTLVAAVVEQRLSTGETIWRSMPCSHGSSTQCSAPSWRSTTCTYPIP
jgi:hypothetical protein